MAADAEQLRSRKPRALDRLFSSEIERLHRFVQHLAPAGTDVEDLVQEALLRIHRAAPEVMPGTSLRLWSLRHAIAVCRERAGRSADARPRLGPLGEPAPAASEGPPCPAALARLPFSERALLVLTEGEGLRPEEIARVLDVRPNAVARLERRTRARLHAIDGHAALLSRYAESTISAQTRERLRQGFLYRTVMESAAPSVLPPERWRAPLLWGLLAAAAAAALLYWSRS